MAGMQSRTFALVFAMLVMGAVAHVARGAAFSHHLATQRYEDVYYLPPNDWLAIGSLGYREAAASLVWLEALVNFGEELGHGGEVQYFYHYADAIIALDPLFKRVYRWAGSLALYRNAEITEADGRRAVDYLERAFELFPNDGEIAWELGATYAYELPPLLKNEKAKEEAKRKGAEYLQSASLLGAGPAWAGLNAASTLTKLGQTEQAKRHLLEIYTTIDDPEAKAEIENRLQALQSESFVMAMREADRELKRRHQRDFPYLNTTLYLLLGARPPVDSSARLLNLFDPRVQPAEPTP